MSGYQNLDSQLPLRTHLRDKWLKGNINYLAPLTDTAAIILYIWMVIFTIYEGRQDKEDRD